MYRTLMKMKRSPEMVSLLTGLVVMTVALVLVVSFAGTALSQGTMSGGDRSAKGEVIAIDNGHHLGTLTLRSDAASNAVGLYPNDTMNIFLVKGTQTRVCSMREPARDLMVGHSATVLYHYVYGLPVADWISEQC
jgi:hypothetical protein